MRLRRRGRVPVRHRSPRSPTHRRANHARTRSRARASATCAVIRAEENQRRWIAPSNQATSCAARTAGARRDVEAPHRHRRDTAHAVLHMPRLRLLRRLTRIRESTSDTRDANVSRSVIRPRKFAVTVRILQPPKPPTGWVGLPGIVCRGHPVPRSLGAPGRTTRAPASSTAISSIASEMPLGHEGVERRWHDLALRLLSAGIDPDDSCILEQQRTIDRRWRIGARRSPRVAPRVVPLNSALTRASG
jgi:hypothetical protein